MSSVSYKLRSKIEVFFFSFFFCVQGDGEVSNMVVEERAYTDNAMEVDTLVKIPFAIVDEIADASPAADDGLQLGDHIVKFGKVEASVQNLLQSLASEAQSNQGRRLDIVVMRQGALVNLTLTPRSWHGRGLLGCHFRIL